MKENINDLMHEIYTHKKAEDYAKSSRIKAEERLIAELSFDKDEGSKSFKDDMYKATLTAKLNRSVDAQKWDEIKDSIPTKLHPVKVVTEYTVDIKGCRWIEENNKELFALISQAITTKHAKVAVKIEVL